MLATSYNLNSIEPFFAPLSAPMIEKAASSQKEETSISAILNLHEVVSAFATKYAHLRQRMVEPRQEIFDLMQKVVLNNSLDTDWMLTELSRYTPNRGPDKLISAEALSRWRESGLIVYRDKNMPDPDNSAALILLRRLIPEKERRWLPTPPRIKQANYFGNEPLWWTWRQDSPTSPIIPCSIPLPSDLPSHALLWTDWLGASWNKAWLRIGTLGCCRWAGTMVKESTMLWALTEEDLEMWNIPISSVYKNALQYDMPLTMHTMSTNALLVLASERLENLHAFSFHSSSQAG